jgi:NTE family protein
VVNFEHLQTCPHATRLFINATNVRTGKVRVFENAEVTLDTVLASACLPNVFKAVEIRGEHFWDGGFMGNPPLFPLIYRGASADIVIVHINPLEREDIPTTAPDIFDRMNEISFNSSLLSELRAIAFVARLVQSGAVDAEHYKQMRIHSIRDDKEMGRHGVSTKLSPEWTFLSHLREIGRAAAGRWLAEGAPLVGHESSIDVSRFL